MLNYGDLTWTAVEEATKVDPKPRIILPVGSIEQHGPHLPLNTDTMIAEHVALAVSNKLSSILFPALSVGFSLEHAGFPGTISLTAHTFSSMVTEIVEHLYVSGFRKFIIINGHGGNRAILDSTITTIKHAHPDVQLYAFTIIDVAKEKYNELRKSPQQMVGHADELETSMMLVIRPELVEMGRTLSEKPNFPPNVSLESEDLAKVTYGWKTKEVSKSGVIGSPNLATRETGRILLDYVIETICRIVENG